MCNCIKELEDQLRSEIHQRFGSEKSPVQYFNIRKGESGRALINIYVDIAKRIRPKETFIVADYCPWCGVKY